MNRLKMSLAFIVLCMLTGCSNDMSRKEIDEINFIHVMGIDYMSDEYILTVVYNTGQGADSESTDTGKEEIGQGRGSTPFEAFQDLRLKNKKTVSIANTGYFLIGDRAAKKGIDACIDFLSRDETVKMESLIFVTKDVQAEDFIRESLDNEQVIHEDLEAIEQKQRELVKRNDNTLVNILNELENKMTCVLIPYLISEDNSFLLQGYAVFDKTTLVDYLDMDTSSGVNFIKNIIKAYPIYLDNNVGLSITNSKCKLKSECEDKVIKIKINLDFETAVKEINTDRNIFTREELNRLTDMQNRYIIDILKKAVNYSIKNRRDILQISRIIQNRHSKSWKEFERNWNNTLPEIQYDYVVNSKITKSFILKN
ncbi:MAG TPA: Ger(x)C family spore germination protein [Mobilitalea sp.]|nr:Ger(x)C family spore germination protein [Mobilitalea sp.]